MKNSGLNIIVSVEHDEQISETYKYNNPSTFLIVDDIRNIKAAPEDNLISERVNNTYNIKDIFDERGIQCDIIFGGPPCQGFSMAGNRIRNGFSFFEDERNLLFKEFIRMVKFLNPQIFIIENVPGILNYNNGKVKDEIYETFMHLDIISTQRYYALLIMVSPKLEIGHFLSGIV